MIKGDIVNILLNKFNNLSKEQANFIISSFRFLNPRLQSVIYNKYELVCYLADEWYADNITKEVIDVKWNKFYNYYNDDNGLYYGFEDENGYLV